MDAVALDGARVLVTGASRGYGAAVARTLADHRAHLVLTATDAGRLRMVAEDCLARGAVAVDVVELDLADPESVDAAAQAVGDAVPRLEGIVLNAGVLGAQGDLLQIDPADIQHAIAVNVAGQLRLVHRLGPLVAPGAGLVLVTSGAAGRPGRGAYGLSKGMLDVMGDMLREEWAGHDVRVVRVNPGPVRTEMRAEAHPDEDPATVPPPSERVAPVLAVLAGEDPGPFVEASEWGLS